MPAKSKAQVRKVHAAARRGEKWALRYRKDMQGQNVKDLPERKSMGSKRTNRGERVKRVAEMMAKKKKGKRARRSKS